MADQAGRRAAWRLGRRAETLCVWWLRLRGWRIVGRRIATPLGEIDIVARRGGTLAMIEVKVRPTMAEAAEAIGPRQRQRIRRAAEAYIGARPALGDLTVRFDVMLLAPRRLPVHVVDAWRE
jgi:putative endonuclease